MNSIQPQDSLDNLSNLQINRQRQLQAQVKQQFNRGLQKLQVAETREVGIAELKRIIEQYREQQFLRGYIAILKTVKPNSNSATKEHQILVISILAATYKQQLLDPLDKPPSLLKTTFRLAEIIHSYFSDHSPTVQQACARALLDLNTHCLGDQSTQTVFSIIQAPLISILKSGVDRSSQATASASLSELINFNRKIGAEQILKKLSPELLSALFKVNSEYHQLFQATLGMLQSQGLDFLQGRLVAFLSKIKSVIDGTRQSQSTNTTNLNAYMCKVNVCKMIQKIGKLLPSSEKEKLFELRVAEALQQAARHRIIQVQLAASKALKAWKDEMVQDSSLEKTKGLSSLEDKRNSKKKERSRSKQDREKAQSQLTFMKEDLEKMVKGGWGANNRAKNYVKRGTGVGGGHVSNAEVSPQNRSGSKSHKEHLSELRDFIKKGAQDNRNIDRFVGIVGQQFEKVTKSPPAKSKASPVRAKSPERKQASKKQIGSGEDQFNFVEDEGDQMMRMPEPAKKQKSEPRQKKTIEVQPDRVVEDTPEIKDNQYGFAGISNLEAKELLKQEKDLFEEARRLNYDYTKMSQDSRSQQNQQERPPQLQYLPINDNYGYNYTPDDQSPPTFKKQKPKQQQKSPFFQGLSELQLGQIVEEYNLSQVSQNLNDVLDESDINNFQASKYENMDSRILEPTQGKSEIQIVKEVVSEKKYRNSAVNKFMKKEAPIENSIILQQDQPLQSAPNKNISHPAYSLNFTQSGQSKVKSPVKREDTQFTLNPKEKFSLLKEPARDEKEIEEEIAMSQYEDSFPARDQPLPVILPKMAPYTHVPLRHQVVPSIIEERQPTSSKTSPRPDFIHDLTPAYRYQKDPPQSKVDYQIMIKNPPRMPSRIDSSIKGSKLTEKSYQEKSRMSDHQTENQNISERWLDVLDKVHVEDYNEAYEAALTLDDPVYLLRLMLLSKIPLKKLSPDIFRRVWAKFMEIYSQKFIDVLTVNVLSEGNDLELLSRCLSVEEMQEALVSLYELSGSSKGKLSYKAANLYNEIDKKLHPE